MDTSPQILSFLAVAALPFLVATTVHEVFHGLAAYVRGDRTAALAGRLSFNPLTHIDPVGTVILPIGLLLFSHGTLVYGYLKPVPVRFESFRFPRFDTAFVAAAGPFSNFVLLILGILAAAWLPHWPLGVEAARFIGQNLAIFITLNALICAFNLFPIPPLDGWRILTALAPKEYHAGLNRLDRGGFILLFVLLFILPALGPALGMDLRFFSLWIFEFVNTVRDLGYKAAAGLMGR